MTPERFRTTDVLEGSVPEFVRVDHPTFVAFLEAYYEWLEQEGNPLDPRRDITTATDIDTTLDEFITYFKSEFLHGFPDKLAVNAQTGKAVDPRKIMKNIRAFYRAKGTERSYRFLFRILYDTNVEFYYPKQDILRASDGKWIKDLSIRTTSTSGKSLFQSVNRQIRQKNEFGEVIAYARVVRASQFRVGNNEVTEFFLSGLTGEFQADLPVEFEVDDKIIRELRVYPVLRGVQINSAGTGYSIGDVVQISSNVGSGAQATVERVGANGEITKIRVSNFGVNYSESDESLSLSVISETGSGAVVSPILGSMCDYPGYYANNDGKLSSNKVTQDNHYFQNFSYVLKTELTIDRYRDAVQKLLHPAGMGFFGQVSIKRCAESELSHCSTLLNYSVTRIGNYTPYTMLSDEDLSDDYPTGYPPNDPLNTPGHDEGDPFWVIYTHPNTWGIPEIPAGTPFRDVILRYFLRTNVNIPFSCCTI